MLSPTLNASIMFGTILFLCDVKQKIRYSGDCVSFVGPLVPRRPLVYWFVKKTKTGQWLERRWTKNAHKRIGVVWNK